MQDPPCKTVRKFLHLLEHSDADFGEELGININDLLGSSNSLSIEKPSKKEECVFCLGFIEGTIV